MTIEERLSLLEQQIAAQVPTPTEYYTSRWSGEEIDNRIASLSNRNLLDNWYFVGGGSQQGGGQFPVNQRGQIIYDTGTASGYGIDRWWSIFCNYNVTTGVLSHSTNQTYGGSMRQAIESPGRLAGRTVVISILVDRVTGAPSISISKSSGINSGMNFIGSTTLSNGLNTLVVNLPNDVGGDTYPMLFVSINAMIGSSFRVIAAKLELGPTQTLAYQDEDGTWQLFETPDYGEELAKCQRYQLVLSSTDAYSSVGSGVVHTTTQARIVISLPNTLRIKPTLSYSGNFQLLTNGEGATITRIVLENINQNCISVQATSSGLVVGQAAILRSNNDVNAKIILDANL